MKVLTIEQMNRLKELGVDVSKASMAIYDIYAGENKVYDIIALNGAFHEDQEYDRFGYGIHSAVAFCKKPVFTLHDIIELLPKEIDGAYLSLELNYCSIEYYYIDYEERISWKSIDFNIEKIIDACYEMLLCVIENGYLKTK